MKTLRGELGGGSKEAFTVQTPKKKKREGLWIKSQTIADSATIIMERGDGLFVGLVLIHR